MRYSAAKAQLLALVACWAIISPSPSGAQPHSAVSHEDHKALEHLSVKGTHFVRSGLRSGARIIFVHGTPGSWQAWSRYLGDASLQCSAELIAVDRPGFGSLSHLEVETSLAAQAEYLKPLIESASGKVIVVGHSLGGTIAAQAAAHYGESLAGVVIIAASLSPKLGGPRWYNTLASLSVIRWFLSDPMRRANDEIMPLEQELLSLVPKLAEVRIPVTLIHGQDDKLVSIKNTDFAELHLQKAKLNIDRVANAGHFILWEQSERVIAAIHAQLGSTECIKANK